MASPSRQPDTGLEHELLDERPFEFNFFQAVRLLRRIYPHRKPVGHDSIPGDEVARFAGDHTLTFPPSDIRDIKTSKTGQPRMTVSFMGLTGREGVLPFHYTDFVIERRLSVRDTTAADFFDLFLHRLVSLFYRAWEKHSIAAGYEDTLRNGTDAGLPPYIFDLVGMGTAYLREHAHEIDDDVLIYYSGLFAQHPHSPAALESMLSDYFQVPVVVESFRGHWFELDPAEYTEMSEDAVRNVLGEGAVAGDAVWNPQARIRLHVGPLTWKQFRAFLPGGSALPKIIALTRFFIDWSVDFDLKLILRKRDVPELILFDAAPKPPMLGLCTWLKTSEFEEDAADVVLSSVPGMATAKGQAGAAAA
jgi:type VI secretion system protein ImpH